jgi:hypothetical protein
VGTPEHVTKLRRDSEKSAQSELKECAYTHSSLKSQGKAGTCVHRVRGESLQSKTQESE